jgi:hypothetical protein
MIFEKKKPLALSHWPLARKAQKPGEAFSTWPLALARKNQGAEPYAN